MATPQPTAPAPLIISTGSLRPGALSGEVAIVTGGGGGIGYEAARSLLWLGAKVVIAEIDVALGDSARASLAAEWSDESVAFEPTDVGDESSIASLVSAVEARFGKVDVVLNNATHAVAGMSVVETPIAAWDRSYSVNLRGPALLARACLPAMIARRHGVFACVSSTGGPFLASYETLKAAQLALANSLDAELSGTGVVAFTIGPGLVPTRTATAAVEQLAPRLGTTVQQFWLTNRGAVLSVEAAGAGFAAAIVLAERYTGQEVSSSQALVDAGIVLASDEVASPPASVAGDSRRIVEASRKVRLTLEDQSTGWLKRSFFERQWMLRDFKQRVGMPVERCLEMLTGIEQRARLTAAEHATLTRLGTFYVHVGDLARGYVKDPKQREEQMLMIGEWSAEVEQLLNVA